MMPFSQKPKHVASYKNGMNLVEIDDLYFLSADMHRDDDDNDTFPDPKQSVLLLRAFR
jgi:hypothetical protein